MQGFVKGKESDFGVKAGELWTGKRTRHSVGTGSCGGFVAKKKHQEEESLERSFMCGQNWLSSEWIRYF